VHVMDGIYSDGDEYWTWLRERVYRKKL